MRRAGGRRVLPLPARGRRLRRAADGKQPCERQHAPDSAATASRKRAAMTPACTLWPPRGVRILSSTCASRSATISPWCLDTSSATAERRGAWRRTLGGCCAPQSLFSLRRGSGPRVAPPVVPLGRSSV